MSSKPGIPSWQHAQPAKPPPPSTSSEPESQPESQAAEEPIEDEPQPDSVSLLQQASTFLEDPTIRDAPREKKVAFLQSKGLQFEEIEKLLGKQGDTAADVSIEGEWTWPKTASQSPAPQPREIAPIVTYPEFLTQSTKPPPLVTTRRLLNTAYITGGLVASMYGLSKYIIAPMAQTLTESRHEFATHTKDNLDRLNSRLGDIVSADPANKPKVAVSGVEDDVSETDSDPTELFHRDCGTQTTPTLSRRPSTTSSADNDSVVTSHENRLKILTSHLKELESTRSNDYASSDSLKTKLSDLRTYLSEMSYQNSYYSGIGGLYGGTYGLPKTKDGKDDYMEAFKTDIRAVKGVLLSARNFPAGGPRIAGRAGG